MPPTPPPLPPQRPPTLGYHQPRRDPPRSFVLDTGGADGYIGINMRWKDNTLQLLAGGAGAIVGAASGFAIATCSTWWTNVVAAMFFGAIAGLLAGVIFPGRFLGIRHFIRRRPSRRGN
jgi:hypothetical protein